MAQDTLRYNHFENCPKSDPPARTCHVVVTRRIQPGHHLTVRIEATDPATFEGRVTNLALSTATKPDDPLRIKNTAPTGSMDLDITHDVRYGGYMVTIDRQSGKPEHDTLRPAILVIQVDAEDKPWSFSGGISFTTIRNQPFVVRKADDDTLRVQEDPDRRDDASVGFGTFFTIDLPRIDLGPLGAASKLGLAIGIGLETSGETHYYAGLAYQIHRGVFLNSGYVLGRVNALPSGLRLDDAVTDPNALSNLQRRNQSGFFIGVSAVFLGGGQSTYSKPFAGTQEK